MVSIEKKGLTSLNTNEIGFEFALLKPKELEKEEEASHFAIFSVTLLKVYRFFLMTPEAEKFNGWAAMIGFVAAFGAYATTGQIIPGIF